MGLVTAFEQEKGHRCNGDQVTKTLMRIKDTTNLCGDVKRTHVLSARKALIGELTDAFQQLACARNQAELCDLRVHEIKTKLKCIGFDPELIEDQVDEIRARIL